MSMVLRTLQMNSFMRSFAGNLELRKWFEVMSTLLLLIIIISNNTSVFFNADFIKSHSIFIKRLGLISSDLIKEFEWISIILFRIEISCLIKLIIHKIAMEDIKQDSCIF